MDTSYPVNLSEILDFFTEASTRTRYVLFRAVISGCCHLTVLKMVALVAFKVYVFFKRLLLFHADWDIWESLPLLFFADCIPVDT